MPRVGRTAPRLTTRGSRAPGSMATRRMRSGRRWHDDTPCRWRAATDDNAPQRARIGKWGQTPLPIRPPNDCAPLLQLLPQYVLEMCHTLFQLPEPRGLLVERRLRCLELRRALLQRLDRR